MLFLFNLCPTNSCVFPWLRSVAILYTVREITHTSQNFGFSQLPSPRTKLLQTIRHPWARRAGLVPEVAWGVSNRSNWTMHYYDVFSLKAHWFYVMLESCKRCSSVNFYRFLYRFTQNLFTWKSTQLVFIILFIACRNWLWLIDQKFKESDTDFLEWKTRSFVLNLVPRMLKITF